MLKRKISYGQMSIEYLILFAIIATLTLISVAAILPDLKEAGKVGFNSCIERISGDGGGGGGGGCFLKGTKITLADGSTKSIDEIKAGDVVLGYDGKGIEPAEVAKVFLHPKGKGYLIITTKDNIEIKVTANHPILQADGYRPARLLKPGGYIFVLKGSELKPTRIESVEIKNEVIDLYNLEVAKLHNFFAEGALCHNKRDPEDPEDPIEY